MQNNQVCGRPVYATSVDSTPVCLMHSADPNKDTALFDKEFDRTINSAAASGTVADFTLFVFVEANYPRKHFAAPCIFDEARFFGPTNFSAATFAQEVRFKEAAFGSEIDPCKASFNSTRFLGKTEFHTTTFWGEANFNAHFEGATAFTMSTFENRAEFFGAKFEDEAYFGSVTFKGDAVFTRAVFKKTSRFGATFVRRAFFAVTSFEQDANFVGATFTLVVDFFDTRFLKRASFFQSKFLDAAKFRGTQFRQDSETLPSLVFTQAEFTRPDAIVFYKTDLSHALFYNCNASLLNFSSVEWRRRPNDKRQLFEELVDLDAASDLRTKPDDEPNERDYGLIAEIYQQLKKNYDDRQDYWTAGDFHYGEMEMKRLHSPSRNKAVRWLHRNLGLVAWYRYASEYGESYVRPLLALVAVLALFTFLFPIPGLVFTKPDTASPTPPSFSPLIYADFPAYIHAYKGPAWIGTLAFFGHSLMTALSVAGFQKELIYQPAYPWGRALALLELLLTSTLIALFLLALRRQFRR
jgi:uncharacterized protein YjbI with pentapeptide repeats